MRKSYLIIILALAVVSSHCKDKEKEAGKSENHVDAARNFVRAALDGKFSEARSFMLQDSINLNLLEVAEATAIASIGFVRDLPFAYVPFTYLKETALSRVSAQGYVISSPL